ncbi:MAG TPA: histidine phosphatase family protein [Gaiellaceae bacterium]|jgi:probable phosphoglycerate mutase
MPDERLIVIARHGESTLNEVQRVNGDPSVPVALTERGLAEARLLGLQLANTPLDVCFHSAFGRTRQTAETALDGRAVPLREEPLLNDIDVGRLEGEPLEAYRAWKRAHGRSAPFPEGESLDDAARRYARGYERILAEPYGHVLVVCHEIPLRYALNGAMASDELDGPVHQLGNAQPFLFTEQALRRAIETIRRLAPDDAEAHGDA